MTIKKILRKPEFIIIALIILFILTGTIIFIIILTKKEPGNTEVEEKIEYVSELENIMEKEKDEILSVNIQTKEPEPVVVTEEPQQPVLIPLDPMYRGFEVAGKITIPKTGVDTPFLNAVTVAGMEEAPCLLYKTGEINVSGNTFIVGHNYRNGTLFSNNNSLEVGDKIIITAMDGSSREYTVYNKFITTAEDTSYLKRETGSAPEITLQSCTDDDLNRIIILAN